MDQARTMGARAGAALRALALVAAALAAVPAVAGEPPATRVGRATDLDSGKPLYAEVHHETFASGHMLADHLVYVDPEGHPFADKQVDFAPDPLLPDFLLRNQRTGQLEGAERVNGELLVRFREHRGADTEREVVDPPRGAVGDAGFDRFIERRFDDIVAGKTELVSFLVPSRHEFIDFRIRRAEGEDRRADTVDFVMEPDSALLRLVVTPVRVRYDRATHRLLRYEGLSNLRDASGDNLKVRIVFRYGPQAAAPAR